jgi:hypothetical protein
MKRTLVVLVALVLLSINGYCQGVLRGAWYCKTSPLAEYRYSGGLEMELFSDGTLEADIFIGAAYFDTATGTHYVAPRTGNIVFSFVDVDGWTYTGVFNNRTRLATGTFRSPLGYYRGKLQMTFVPVSADTKASKSKGEPKAESK